MKCHWSGYRFQPPNVKAIGTMYPEGSDPENLPKGATVYSVRCACGYALIWNENQPTPTHMPEHEVPQ